MSVFAAALAFDLLLGEFPTPLHPVVWLGTSASALLRCAPSAGRARQFLYGTMLTAFVVAFAIGLVVACDLLTADTPVLHFAASVFFLKASFALRALVQAGNRVARPLKMDDLPAARAALRSLCSRDPSDLSEDELVAATIESLAENASDSFVAPLFYVALFGIPGAMAYRAINTLDAMIGYRGPTIFRRRLHSSRA